jgi:hypothetical protein
VMSPEGTRNAGSNRVRLIGVGVRRGVSPWLEWGEGGDVYGSKAGRVD